MSERVVTNEMLYDKIIEVQLEFREHRGAQGVFNKVVTGVGTATFGGLITVVFKVFSSTGA